MRDVERNAVCFIGAQVGDQKAPADALNGVFEDFSLGGVSEREARAEDADRALATQLGATGTPAVFVNGKYVRGAQPLAASFAGACSLNIECQQSRIEFRLKTRYLDEQADNLDDALARIARYTAAGKAVSIGLLGNAAELLPELVRRGRSGQIRPDLVTDQTSAHDLINGYLPIGWSVSQWQAAAKDAAQHEALKAAAAQGCAVHVRAMLDFQAMGIPVVDYGNNIRQVAFDEGVQRAFDFPGFVPAYVRPLFCRGKGPFRWVALSGDPEDIRKTDAKMKELFPQDAHLHPTSDLRIGATLRQRKLVMNKALPDFNRQLLFRLSIVQIHRHVRRSLRLLALVIVVKSQPQMQRAALPSVVGNRKAQQRPMARFQIGHDATPRLVIDLHRPSLTSG